MPSWIVFAAATAFTLAGADFFVKLASGKLSNSVAVFIYGTCTFLFGVGWMVWQRVQGEPQFAEPVGILAAAGAGLTFSLVTVGLYATFGAGAPISLASPFVRVGGLLLASLIGLTLLGEPFSWRYAFGVLLAVGGVYLIVTR